MKGMSMQRPGGRREDPHHFESIRLDAEVWVVFVALDHTGLDAVSPTFDEDLGTIHREELHLLHFSDSPEENLNREQAELSLKGPGRSQHVWLRGRNIRCPSPGTTVCSSRKGWCGSSRAPSEQLCLPQTPPVPSHNTAMIAMHQCP